MKTSPSKRPVVFLGLALSFAAACTSFGDGTAPPPTVSPEGGTPGGTLPDGALAPKKDGGAVVAEDGAVTFPFCQSAAAKDAAACDDFESPEPLEARWTFTRLPEGTGNRVGDVPVQGGIASFSLADNPAAQPCAYHWIEQTLKQKATRVRFSFLLRPVRVQDNDQAAAVAYLRLDNASSSAKVEHYLYVRKNSSASYYHHSLSDAHHTETGQRALRTWVRIEVRVDLSMRKIEMDLDGKLVADHPNIYPLTNAEVINFGVGFPCTNGGGAFDFDDVLVEAEP